MKAVIIYFSGTGNTRFVSEIIAQELQNRKVETEMYSIEEKEISRNHAAIRDGAYDFLILGCPKYYECPTLDFERWLKKELPVSKRQIPVMMFVTQVGPLATKWNHIGRILSGKGYCLQVAKSFPIANNMTIFDVFPPTEEDKIRENVKKIRAEVPALMDDFLSGKENREEVGMLLGMTERVVAVAAEKLFAAFGVKYAASEQCTGCTLCEKNCPKGNIKMKDNRPVFSKKCMFCMRCINHCPVHAILYNHKQCPQLKLPPDIRKMGSEYESE